MTMKRVMTSIQAINLLLFAMVIITSCSNDDNIFDEPAISKETSKSYTLTVEAAKGDNTVNGSDTQTRALSLDGKTLNATWAAGEVVQVYSVTGEGYEEMESSNPVGTLSAQSSGVTTTLKGEFISTYTPTVGAKLRLKFNDKPDYTNQKGTLEYIAANCDYATADVTISEVGTDGDVTTTAASFENQQAIVKFSLTRQDGTTPVEATSLTVSVGSRMYNVTLITPASNIFVAIQKASNKAVSLSVNSTSGHFTYDKSSATFEMGKYYAIGVKLTRHQSRGDLYYSDGTSSEMLEAGKTPIGVIAYLGTDQWSENGVTLRDNSTTLQSHGLVLCLNDVAENVVWGTTGSVSEFGESLEVANLSGLMRTNDVSGYMNTKTLATRENAATDHPALYRAWSYTALSAPATTTGWFLPSAQQWVKMLTGIAGLSDGDIKWQDFIDKDCVALARIETALAKAGSGNYSSMTDRDFWLWTSTEGHSGAGFVGRNATIMNIKTPLSDGNYGFNFANEQKSMSYGSSHPVRTRPVLAF